MTTIRGVLLSAWLIATPALAQFVEASDAAVGTNVVVVDTSDADTRALADSISGVVKSSAAFVDSSAGVVDSNAALVATIGVVVRSSAALVDSIAVVVDSGAVALDTVHPARDTVHLAPDSERLALDATQAPIDTGGVSIGDTILTDFFAFGTDAVILFTAPARFVARDWAIAGGAVAAGLIAVPFDDEIQGASRDAQGTDGSRITTLANIYGTWAPALALSGGLYVTGLALDWPRVRVAGRHIAQAVAYAGLVTTLAKLVIGRQRPLYNGGQYVFVPFRADDRYYSHPSGHATLAFAVSSSLAADIDHPAATVALYGLATLTALSRVYDDRHWTSDVIIGAAIGTAFGYGVANIDAIAGDADGSAESHSSVIVTPTSNGLAVVWTF